MTVATQWVSDANGNKCSAEYFGSIEAAQKALDSLKNCKNCSNCSHCSYCSHCSGCSYCSYCSNCSGCSGCSNCSDCSRCSRCSDCSGCSDCSYATGVKSGIKRSSEIPKIENIHTKVFDAVSKPDALKMDTWHTCETTHCRAGWVVHLAGKAGKALEAFHDTPLAAALIYKASSPHRVPMTRFYETNEEALADMKRLAELEAKESSAE